MKYLVTIQTKYGSLTIDDIEALSEQEAERTAYYEAESALQSSKIAEIYEYTITPKL